MQLFVWLAILFEFEYIVITPHLLDKYDRITCLTNRVYFLLLKIP